MDRQLAATQWHSWRVGSDTYYDILGVSSAATTEEIKARYRNLILRIHPDVDGPAALFRQVQEAYEVLSDPVRRTSYDQLLQSYGRAARIRLDHRASRFRDPNFDMADRGDYSGRGPESADTARFASYVRKRRPDRQHAAISLFRRYPAGAVATAGVILIVLGAAPTQAGPALILLGAAVLVIAGVAGLGSRGKKERAAYQRSGMTAVDAMTGREFESLLEHFFANKGYRVARIGGRGNSGPTCCSKTPTVV